MVLRGWARTAGTCGEWIQGSQRGVPFLVSCPVNRYVNAKVELILKELSDIGELGERSFPWFWDLPHDKEKTHRVLINFALAKDLPPFQAKLHLTSQLPIGKGMASSTADMVAALGSLIQALELPWEPQELVKFLLEIEPSDPVMFPGVTEFAHQDGSYMKSLCPRVPAKLLVIDGGGRVDTLSFNKRRDLSSHYSKHEGTIRKALTLFYEGVREGDIEKIGQASTISAQCNQEINPKVGFEDFVNWVNAQEGWGVVTAHSGTLLSGIFPENIPESIERELEFEAKVRFGLEMVEWMETTEGGLGGGKEHAWWQFTGSEG
ncbi:MAG: GHMP kinase [Desulfitobacterium sp.]|nr:GHMP kinase [Desulfitobacterium sp.]